MRRFGVLYVIGFSIVAQAHLYPSPDPSKPTTGAANHAAAKKDFKSLSDQPYFSNATQMTFGGEKTGEAYPSADGRYLVFQSEREPQNPFYQIYVMDRKTGDELRVSPGDGKTTCAWMHPSNRRILFSSTHLDPELKAKVERERADRANPIQGKYSWSFDDQFDLFEAQVELVPNGQLKRVGKTYRRIAPALGYDAEGSYSPDGQWIAFASNRHAYADRKNLSEADQKKLDQDPSLFMDIYLVRADGRKAPERITTHFGYDGGPFFSSDGKSLTWRRFSSDGTTAEIMVMDIATRKESQITNMKAMNWAPFFHPSGDYLIFTSNRHGYENFELFIVDAKGEREPLRVTELSGFDGLPVFSPDGLELLWTRKNEAGESQVYRADWNDQKVREMLQLRAWLPVDQMAQSEFALGNVLTELKLWTAFLSSPQLLGRATGSSAEQVWTDTVARYFSKLGLKPLEGAKDFFHEFEFTKSTVLRPQMNRFTLFDQGHPRNLEVEKDWVPSPASISAVITEAPLIFMGYGIRARKNDLAATLVLDSYQDQRIDGKWAVVLQGQPDEVEPSQRHFLSLHSNIQAKAAAAKAMGAVGLIVLIDDDQSRAQLAADASAKILKYQGNALSPSGIAVVKLRLSQAGSLVEELEQHSKSSFKTLLTKLGRNEPVVVPLSLKAHAEIAIEAETAKGRSVIARLKGKDSKLDPVVVGAHGDHLGATDHSETSLNPSGQSKIHYGADDNASGMAAVLQLAKQLVAHSQSGARPERDLIFAIWSGEELGVLGSQAWVKERVLKKEKIGHAYLNFDMVGRLRQNKLIVQGAGSSDQWGGLLESALASTKSQLNLIPSKDSFLPTDSISFVTQKIPSISLFTGAHSEYHTSNDRYETLNHEGLSQVIQFGSQIVTKLSRRNMKLAFRALGLSGAIGSTGGSSAGRKFRLYIGAIPDYASSGDNAIKGVRISGATEGSPAQKAGFQAGDVIQKIGPVKIDTIYDYVYALGALKPGEEILVEIRRGDGLVSVRVAPELKEK